MILDTYSKRATNFEIGLNLKTNLLIGFALLVAVSASLMIGSGFGLYAIILVVSIAASLVVAINYQIGVFLVVFMLPISMTQLFPRQMFGVTGVNPFNVVFVVVCMSIAFAYRFRAHVLTEVIPWQLLLFLIAPCLVAIGIGLPQIDKIPSFMYINNLVMFETWPAYIIDGFVKPFMQVGVAIQIAIFVANNKKPDRIIIAISAGAMTLAVVTLVLLAQSGIGLGALAQDNAGMRGVLSFTGLHANSLGLMFNLCLALLLFSIPAPQSTWQRSFAILGAIVCAVMIAMTFSRAAMGAMAILTLWFLISTRRFVSLFIGALIVVIGLFFLPDAFYDRLLTGVANRDLQSISAGRLDMIWIPLLQIVPDHFILGNGIFSVLWSTPLITGRMLAVGHAHNAYLNALLDMGLIGLILVLLFYLFVIMEIRRLRESDPDPYFRQFMLGVQAGIVLLLIQGLTGDSLIPSPSQVYLWCGLGVVLGRRALIARNLPIIQQP